MENRVAYKKLIFLLIIGSTNPYEMDMTDRGEIIYPADPKPPRVWFRINFTRPGTYLSYNKVQVRSSSGGEKSGDGGKSG